MFYHADRYFKFFLLLFIFACTPNNSEDDESENGEVPDLGFTLPQGLYLMATQIPTLGGLVQTWQLDIQSVRLRAEGAM